MIPRYRDGFSRRREASPEALLAVLRLLGVSVRSSQDAPAALRRQRLSFWRELLEPVTVALERKPAAVSLRIPIKEAQSFVSARLLLEDGSVQSFPFNLARLPAVQTSQVEGVRYAVKRLKLPHPLPYGYHRFALEWGGKEFTSWIFSAPVASHTPPERRSQTWGLFIPPYALHSRHSWGAGDFSDLERFVRWTATQGGRIAGFLPFLASFLEHPFDPSPYAPASRLFWNEFFIDVSRVPELKASASAREDLESAAFQKELRWLRKSPHVAYRRGLSVKRQILDLLARSLWTGKSRRYAPFRQFIQAQPLLNDYAQFRAAVERQRAPWPQWPKRMREGLLQRGDYDEEVLRYHLYVQWIAATQVASLEKSAQRAGVKLYLDLPLGAHPYSYDVWRERHSFAVGASAGAPPDLLFRDGQRWGFPPLHPESLRADGYRYVIATLRHSMKQARLLRLDHVMGFHRLFWIPQGMLPEDGAYVRYRPEEFYAILSIESERHKTVLVGEDLGTVPAAVRRSMNRHRIKRTYVLQLAARPHAAKALPSPPAGSMASLNTHDTAPFAAFLKDQKVLREALKRFFKTNDAQLLRTCLIYLMKSTASIVLVNLEDLWGEKRPQNLPGVLKGQPNWRRKTRYSFEILSKMPQVLQLLRELRDAGRH